MAPPTSASELVAQASTAGGHLVVLVGSTASLKSKGTSCKMSLMTTAMLATKEALAEQVEAKALIQI